MTAHPVRPPASPVLRPIPFPVCPPAVRGPCPEVFLPEPGHHSEPGSKDQARGERRKGEEKSEAHGAPLRFTLHLSLFMVQSPAIDPRGGNAYVRQARLGRPIFRGL